MVAKYKYFWEVLEKEADNKNLFINKGSTKSGMRGYFVKNDYFGNGIYIKKFLTDDDNSLFFITYEEIHSIHDKSSLIWRNPDDESKVNVVVAGGAVSKIVIDLNGHSIKQVEDLKDYLKGKFYYTQDTSIT
jgi:hypothetical protein